jgi:hypothetical protein
MTTKLAKHSPAPWEISQYENWKGFSIWAPGAGCIAERWYASEHEDVPILANARLIAAAPALLEALKSCLSCLQMECEECYGECPCADPCAQCRAKAAIRAAVGEQEENTK